MRSIIPKVAAMLVLVSTMLLPLSVTASGLPSTVTHIQIQNGSSQPIIMAVTLESPNNNPALEDGCTTNVADLNMINMTPGQPQTVTALTPYTSSDNQQAIFTIPANWIYEVQSTKSNPNPLNGAPAQQNCMQGFEFTFNQFPTCPNTTNPPAFPTPGVPGPAIPNGVSGFEPTINLPGTISGSSSGAGLNESWDITCVNGSNSLIQVQVTSPSSGALPWFYDNNKQVGPGASLVTACSWVSVALKCDNNCFLTSAKGLPIGDRPGVFPFGCSQCNIYKDPGPPCGPAGIGQFCAALNGLPPNNGCNFQRTPNASNIQTQQFGGTLLCTYLGPANPPSVCGGIPAVLSGHHSNTPFPQVHLTGKQWRDYFRLKYGVIKGFTL